MMMDGKKRHNVSLVLTADNQILISMQCHNRYEAIVAYEDMVQRLYAGDLTISFDGATRCERPRTKLEPAFAGKPKWPIEMLTGFAICLAIGVAALAVAWRVIP